mgnify:CR=1 FL=1
MSKGKFDFDHWMQLAEKDPMVFFRARERAIRLFIEAHPDSASRLTELQARIDAMRAVAGSPLQAARAISAMLERNLEQLAETLQKLQTEAEAMQAVSGGLAKQ